jgi:hypothetical protein
MDEGAAEHCYHDDPERFRICLTFTEAHTGFSARLIEKDYYCTLVLRELPRRFVRARFQRGHVLEQGPRRILSTQ